MSGASFNTQYLSKPSDWLSGAHVAQVANVQDPDSRGRVQVQILSVDAASEALIWARVATSFAGENYGMHALPDVGEEVLVVFLGNSTAHPVVIGSLWNGNTALPDQLPGDTVDRWSLNGKAGSRIAIVEQDAGSEYLEFSTPNGVKATLTDGEGGSILCEAAGSTITIDSQGITIHSGSKVTVKASATCEISASMLDVKAPLAKFENMIQCQTIQTTNVIASTYTPGAGNIW